MMAGKQPIGNDGKVAANNVPCEGSRRPDGGRQSDIRAAAEAREQIGDGRCWGDPQESRGCQPCGFVHAGRCETGVGFYVVQTSNPKVGTATGLLSPLGGRKELKVSYFNADYWFDQETTIDVHGVSGVNSKCYVLKLGSGGGVVTFYFSGKDPQKALKGFATEVMARVQDALMEEGDG